VSNPKWQIGPVKLANGEEAFIDAINEGQDANRYTGRVRSVENNQWISAAWHLNGRYAGDMFLESNDLLNLAPPPKKTVRIEGWLNIYDDNSANFFDRREDADKEDGRSACVPFGITVTEGEGLS
jgi:hypothetical protein